MILISFIFIVQVAIIITAKDKLIHVHAVWRHGERNPRELFPGDLNDASAFPEGLGRLTKNGIQQLFDLGQYFRSRYIEDNNFLSPKYIDSEIYPRSTDFNRTITSAMAFYSGLYSNSTTMDMQIFAPVPIHTIPLADDFLLLLRIECPRLKEMYRIMENSETIQALLQKHHGLLVEVSNKTQTPIDFHFSVVVYDTTTIEKSQGLPALPWITPEKSEEFDQLFVDYASAQYGFVPFPNDSFPYDLQFELAKISCGPLMAEVVDRLKLKIQCLKNFTSTCMQISDQKLYTYSAHDTSLIELFGGLGFKNFTFGQKIMPSYTSTIILELWEDEAIENTVITDDNLFSYYYVKVYYYQNSSVKTAKYIGDLLPECQGKGCSLHYLIERAELLRPRPHLKSYCTQAVISSTSKNSFSLVIFLTFIVLYYITFGNKN